MHIVTSTRTRGSLVVLALAAAALLFLITTNGVSAFVYDNSVDGVTITHNSPLKLSVSGTASCLTEGERVTVLVLVDQESTGAHADNKTSGRCSAGSYDWSVSVQLSKGNKTAFENGTATVGVWVSSKQGGVTRGVYDSFEVEIDVNP